MGIDTVQPDDQQTPPIQQAPQSTPLESTVGNTSVTGQPPQDPSQAATPQQSGQPGQTPSPQGPKPAQAPQQQVPQQAPKPSMTATQKFLSRAREISDEMVGGDPYKTSINPNTGETTRTRQPLSGRAISLSIIMEALQGGLAGAGAHGSNAAGEAAQAGLKQGEKIADQRQEQQANQDQQAQTDLRNRQQVVTNLLQTRLLAQNLGKQSLDQAQKSVDQYASRWKQHQDDPTSILGQDMSHDAAYAMLGKLPMGTAEVEIIGAHPRIDKDGKVVYQNSDGQVVTEDTPGAYVAPDFDYAVVKSDAKVNPVDKDGNLDKEHTLAQKRGFVSYSGADGKIPTNFTISKMADQAALQGSRIASATQQDVNQRRASLGLEPINIDDDLASSSNIRQGLMIYSAALHAPNGNFTNAYNTLVNAQGGKYASAAGTIQNWYGGESTTAALDAKRSSQDFDTAVKNGQPVVSKDDAQRAIASGDKTVQSAGKARMKQIDDEEVRQKSRDAMATESAHVWGQEKIDANKQALQLQGGNADTLALPAKLNTDGVMVHQEYLDSLPRDVQAQLKAMAYGRDEGPNSRTKEGKALDKMLNAAYPNYDKSKYTTWQATNKDATVGKTAQGINNLNTAFNHAAELYDNAGYLSTLPGISSIAGGLGNDSANKYNLASIGFSEELGKAVKNGVLTQPQAEQMEAAVRGHNPASAKSKVRAALPLIKARIDELQATIDRANPIGVSGIHVLHDQARANYERISGNSANSPSQHPDTPAGPVTYSLGGKSATFPNQDALNQWKAAHGIKD